VDEHLQKTQLGPRKGHLHIHIQIKWGILYHFQF
jgi:hypothetical protein